MSELGPLWRPRYFLASMLISTGMRIMPRCRYRRELSEALWGLSFRVQAHSAALRSAETALPDRTPPSRTER